MIPRKYATIGLAVILMVMMFAFYSDSDNLDPEYTGIVSDIREGSNGFTFQLNTVDDSFRCYSSSCPEHLGYYGVIGSFSDDDTIFFVSTLIPLDRR